MGAGGGAGIVGLLILCGFYLINPNEAAAIQLFGAYKGTDREEGLRWVLPWLTRKKIAVRANIVISDKIKVNDLRGNPIEMSAQVVWRVPDTAQAMFDRSDEHRVGYACLSTVISRLTPYNLKTNINI